MNGQDRSIRHLKEFVDYAAVLQTVLECAGTGHEARGKALETVSEHSRDLLRDVTEPFSARYREAVSLFERRIEEHEGNLRWRKVFWFAFKEDLSKEAWNNAYREFKQLSREIARRRSELLGQIVAARNVMMEQGAEAIASVLGGEVAGLRRLVAPGLGSGSPEDGGRANQPEKGER